MASPEHSDSHAVDNSDCESGVNGDPEPASGVGGNAEGDVADAGDGESGGGGGGPAPFVFEPQAVAEAVAELDQVGASAASYLHTARDWADGASDGQEKSPLRREVGHLLEYELDVSHPISERHGTALEPATMPPTGYAFPTAVDDVSDDIVALWQAVAEFSTVPMVSARAHDLLFTRKSAPVGQHLNAALADYLGAAPAADDLTASDMITRAWTLARLSNNASGEREARNAAWAQLHRQQGDERHAAGANLPLLELLSVAPRDGAGPGADEPDLDEMLTAARAQVTMPHVLDRLIAIASRRAVGDEQTLAALKRARVSARLAAAEQTTDAAVRMVRYEDTAALAKMLGVTDLGEQAVRAMQNIDPESIEWQSTTLDLTMPRYLIEPYVRRFTAERDWRGALMRWVSTPPPSGSYEANRKSTKQSLVGTVFWRIFPTKVFGPHGLPQSSVSTDDEEALDHQVRQIEQVNMSFYGRMLAEGLVRIGELPGRPSRDEIMVFFVELFAADSGLGYTLAHAIELFWDEDYTAAAAVVTPAIEAAGRALMLEADRALYEVEAGKSIGQFVQLGRLLPMMERTFLETDWVRFLSTLLLPAGSNLRNTLSHGFVLDVSRTDAAMLIRAAATLIVIADAGEARDDRQRVKAPNEHPRFAGRRQILRRVRAAWFAAKTAYWTMTSKPSGAVRQTK